MLALHKPPPPPPPGAPTSPQHEHCMYFKITVQIAVHKGGAELYSSYCPEYTIARAEGDPSLKYLRSQCW